MQVDKVVMTESEAKSEEVKNPPKVPRISPMLRKAVSDCGGRCFSKISTDIMLRTIREHLKLSRDIARNMISMFECLYG